MAVPEPRRSTSERGAILEVLRSELPQLCREYAISKLGVFGSYARGEQSRRSDLDLLVEFDRVPSLLQLVRMERELGERLGVEVDLVMRSALKPSIVPQVLQNLVSV